MDIIEFDKTFVVNHHVQHGRLFEDVNAKPDDAAWFLELGFVGGATFRVNYETEEEALTAYRQVKNNIQGVQEEDKT